jgi:hypothetical protein
MSRIENMFEKVRKKAQAQVMSDNNSIGMGYRSEVLKQMRGK